MYVQQETVPVYPASRIYPESVQCTNCPDRPCVYLEQPKSCVARSQIHSNDVGGLGLTCHTLVLQPNCVKVLLHWRTKARALSRGTSGGSPKV